MSDFAYDPDVSPDQRLIQLPVTTKKFQASGQDYYVEDTISIERYKTFQRLEIELGYGIDFATLQEKLTSAYKLQNESKFADVSVMLYSLIEGSVIIGDKTPMGLYVATLFVNKANEDRTEWSMALADEKLADWKQIDAAFFLRLAVGKQRNFKQSLMSALELIEKVSPLKTSQDQPREGKL